VISFVLLARRDITFKSCNSGISDRLRGEKPLVVMLRPVLSPPVLN
jgi:hypothetical protein